MRKPRDAPWRRDSTDAGEPGTVQFSQSSDRRSAIRSHPLDRSRRMAEAIRDRRRVRTPPIQQHKGESEMPLDQTAPLIGTGRRSLLKTAGYGTAALGFTLGVTSKLMPAQAQSAPSIADVLNFALNLEYLEAEFYLRAATGQGLQANETTGTGSQGGVTWGGSAVPFKTSSLRELANAIAVDEHNHVLFLRSALGSTAVAEPNINLLNSFTTLARAAGIVGPTGTFNPFQDELSFLLGAYIFEDVGVSAYSGAAGYLTSDPPVLAAAAGILAVEAYHGGAIRANLIQRPGALTQDANKVSMLRRHLSHAPDDIGPYSRTAAHIADADSNSIAYARSVEQVMNIVYGGGSRSNFLFFPTLLNGAIH